MSDLSRQKKITLVVNIGEALLKNGGEVYRVEDTMKRLLTHYGFNFFNVYTVSNGIFVTVDENGENPVSCVRNIPAWSVDLGKIAELNKLSRDICSDKCSVEQAYEQLDAIKDMNPKSPLPQMLGTGIGSGAFCYIFGGNIVDVLLAIVIGFILKWFLEQSAKKRVSKFITNIIGSVLVTILAVSLHQIMPVLLVDKVIIGSIMIMVPGVSLTTSIRDFFGGDYLSGSIHFIDALLTAVCIATGVGVAIKAFALIGWV